MRRALLSLLLAVSCSPIEQAHTVGACATGSGYRCRTNADCQDGMYCNGVERCAASEPGTNACGCVRSETAPCRARGESCDERGARCIATAAPADPCAGPLADLDGDGMDSYACGGQDCDDQDALTFPGNVERCEGTLWDGRPANDHDEDCNPCTVDSPAEDGDGDHDHFPTRTCQNRWMGGVEPVGCNLHRVELVRSAQVVRGADCDDRSSNVHPFEAEVCNGVDDDCDEQTDEGLLVSSFEDSDDDGYGNASRPASVCPGTRGYAPFGHDCDDTNAALTPGSVTCDSARGPSAVRLCDKGSWVNATCSPQRNCVSQPNGTGVCL